MKKVIGIWILFVLLLQSCKDSCDPGLLPEDEILYINILQPGGGSYIKYTGNTLPDSVKVLNMTTNALVNRYLLRDSILVIENYDKANNAITNFKISKGTILKPDTVQITIKQTSVQDKCGSDFSVARFNQIAVNSVLKCTGCPFNTVLTIQR